jgi:hypothetical protein
MKYSQILLSVTIASLTIALSLGIYDLFVDLKKLYIDSHFTNVISDLIYLVIVLAVLLILILFTRNSKTTSSYIMKNFT